MSSALESGSGYSRAVKRGKKSLNMSLLIAEVRARRPIWDKHHEQHRQRDFIEEQWNEISKVVELPALLTRTKWKNIKDFYRRETKKCLTEPDYEPRWRYYESLKFLYKQQIEFDQKDEDKCSKNSNNSLLEVQKPSKQESENNNGLSGSIEDESNQQLQNSNQKSETYEANGYLQTQIRDLHTDDADMCFFRSLVPHMKELCPRKRMQLRIKIHEMVYKEVYPNQSTHTKSKNDSR